jgi:hydrogenase-4 component B
VWNHAIFKSLLFFVAGSVLHASGTRQIDLLGGLAKKMPFTAGAFLLGAIAICGLPPLNGFISEFFIYIGFFGSAVSAKNISAVALLGAPVLAMIGALAVSCFVKVYGAAFLGSPRSTFAERSKESPVSMLIPMGVLSLLCAVIGLFPFLTIPVLERTIGDWLARPCSITLSSLIPFGSLEKVIVIAVVLLALSVIPSLVRARVTARRAVTWDCGYAKSDARIQYTAASFARSLVDIFSWFLRPKNHLPAMEGNFPAKSTLDSHVGDPVLDRHLIPGFDFARNKLRWFSRFQQGQTQLYILYVVFTLGILLVTLIPFKQIFFALFIK